MPTIYLAPTSVLPRWTVRAGRMSLSPGSSFKDSVGAHVLELQRALYEVEALVVRVAMWLEGIAGFVQPRERPETLVLDICDCLFLRLEEPLDNRDCCH